MRILARFALAAALAACSEPQPPPAPAAGTTPPAPAAAAPEKLETAVTKPKPDPDAYLAAQVKRALEGEPGLGAEGIDVTAAGGVVRLWGTVESAAKRRRAEALAAAVPGAKSVESKLQVVKGS